MLLLQRKKQAQAKEALLKEMLDQEIDAKNKASCRT